MTKRVAVEGDVKKTAGTGHTKGYTDAPGWKAGDVSYEKHPHLKVGGKPVIWKASCTFTYEGTDPAKQNAKAVDDLTETVELVASGTMLEPSPKHALLHGDHKEGTKAVSPNKLEVEATGPLTSDPR